VVKLPSGPKASFLDGNGKGLNVFTPPLNDCEPRSPAVVMHEFATNPDEKSRTQLHVAMPNTWAPGLKFGVDHAFAERTVPMPHLQIFARDLPGLSRADRFRIALRGDFEPYGKLVLEAIQEAEKIRGKAFDGEINLFGAGLGIKTLGAAKYLAEHSDYQVGAVTLMNLIISDDFIAKKGLDYAGRTKVGDTADITVPSDWRSIPESLVRREVGLKSESSMRRRQAAAILGNPACTIALLRGKRAAEYIDALMNLGATITVAQAANESLTSKTNMWLPGQDAQFHYVSIVGVDGTKPGMATNEQDTLAVTVNQLGIANHIHRMAK
ncbi:hypothetical protein KDA14_05765, partial [Candidatus Saccharibacteria bacterium]|nr:hypothetical protein [Candidatus Saccharibacteria bacterium]